MLYDDDGTVRNADGDRLGEIVDGVVRDAEGNRIGEAEGLSNGEAAYQYFYNHWLNKMHEY